MPRNLAFDRARPIPFGRPRYDDHRPPVARIPILHRLEHGNDLGVVGAVFHGENIPSVGSPLIDEIVAAEFTGDDATQQYIVDAGIVVREDHPQALADLQGQGLRLEFLRVAFGHGEFAFERDHLRRTRRANHVPERGFSGGGSNADARRTAVHIVRDIHRFGVARQSFDAADFGLREKRMIGKTLSFEERLERARAAAKSQRINRQDGGLRVDVVPFVAGGFEFAFQRLAHDHPKRVARGDVVSARQHEFVAEGMFGTPVIVAQAAQFRSREMGCHVEGRVGQWSAEVPGLRIVPEQHQGHAGHVPDVFQAFPVKWRLQRFNGG